MNDPKQEFDQTQESRFAIVELMGRVKLAGVVSTVTEFGTTLMRMDVPKVDEIPAFTRLIGGSAIYQLTYCDEITVTLAACELREHPITVFIPDIHQTTLVREENVKLRNALQMLGAKSMLQGGEHVRYPEVDED